MSEFTTDSTVAYMTYLGASMNDMRLRKKFVDTILICGEQRFPAHRLVLCSRSPVFQGLLLQDSNSQTCSTNAVDLEDVEPRVLDTILDFMYLGKINNINDISFEDFNKILTAAELLNVNGCVLYLTHELLERKPSESITFLWDWAFEFSKETVIQNVISHIADNISSICKEKEFYKLSRYQLVAILSHTKLTDRDPQDDVLEAILNWIHEDTKNREDCFSNFVSFVALHKLSEPYMKRLIRDEPLIQQLPDFQRVIAKFHSDVQRPVSPFKILSSIKQNESDDKSNFQEDDRSMFQINLDPSNQKSKEKLKRTNSSAFTNVGLRFYDIWSISQPQVRLSTFTFPEALAVVESLTLLVIGRDDMNRFVVHLFIPEKQTWSLSHEIDIPHREKMSYALHKGKLFLIGGEDPYQRKQPDVFIFNIMTQVVTEGPPMRISRCKAGFAQDKRIAYIAGGLNRFGNFMTHVECLDMVDEVWRIVPSMKEKRQSPSLAVVNGELFAVGGFTNRCESYNPHWDSWHSIVPMPDFFSQTAVVTTEFNDRIYAFRYFKPDRVCCLDPSKNEWRVIRTSGTTPERILSMHNLEGELWTLDRCGRLYVFDVCANTWFQSFCCPKSFTRPMYLFVVNVAELNHIYEPTTPVQSLR